MQEKEATTNNNQSNKTMEEQINELQETVQQLEQQNEEEDVDNETIECSYSGIQMSQDCVVWKEDVTDLREKFPEEKPMTQGNNSSTSLPQKPRSASASENITQKRYQQQTRKSYRLVLKQKY